MSNAEKMVSVQRGLLMEAEASLRASGMAVTLSADIREVLDQSVEVTGSDVIRWMDEYADEQRRGEPIGRLMRDKNERIVIVPIGDPHITDGMLVYASADAGEVERLRAELTEQREIFAMQEDKIDGLRAQLASANADKDAYAQNAIDLRDSLVDLNGIERNRDTAFALLRRCLLAVREQHCDEGKAEFDLPAPLLADIDAALSASAETSAPVERDEQAEFESWHAKNVTPNLGRYKCGKYSSNGTESRWLTWQARAALEHKP